MRKINFKHPRYVIPLIILPFVLILFYVYRHSARGEPVSGQDSVPLSAELGEVSAQVSAGDMGDKFRLLRERFKKGEGETAISSLEELDSFAVNNEQNLIDSVRRSIGLMPSARDVTAEPPAAKDHNSQSALAAAINELSAVARPVPPPAPADEGMKTFRAQMAIVDSMSRAHNPGFPAKGRKIPPRCQLPARESLRAVIDTLQSEGFNTIRPVGNAPGFIPAMVDEQIIVSSGSRVRLRLLKDIRIAQSRIKKGSVLYGLVTGFSAQRVHITVSSVLIEGSLLAVNLQLYDTDGIKGLYIPGSAFRDLSKELGAEGMAGAELTMGQGQISSLIGRVFRSGSSALNSIMRRNTAKITYSSNIYLIDPAQLSP